MSDNIIKLNQELIHTELKDLVKNSVEETLNAMLDAEADRLVNAERYARDEDRKGYRAGHYDRSFSTTAGDVNLKMPKLKGVTFETAIIERYRRRETSVEEALIEMYLAGVSVRRVEDITEALWGTRVSPGTISNLNQKAYENELKGILDKKQFRKYRSDILRAQAERAQAMQRGFGGGFPGGGFPGGGFPGGGMPGGGFPGGGFPGGF